MTTMDSMFRVRDPTFCKIPGLTIARVNCLTWYEVVVMWCSVLLGIYYLQFLRRTSLCPTIMMMIVLFLSFF